MNHLKKYRLILGTTVLFVGLTACISQKNGKNPDSLTQFEITSFEPVEAFDFEDKIPVIKNDTVIYKEIFKCSTEEILDFLRNESTFVSIAKLDGKGGARYLPFYMSEENSTYKVTMDYLKFRNISQYCSDTSNIICGFKRVGVGLRLSANVTTFESGINLGDLATIGLSAKANTLSGTLTIEVIGISSKDVTNLLPLPSEINQTTIQNAIQALATIKSKIYDKDIKLYPQTVAIKNSLQDSVLISNMMTKIKETGKKNSQEQTVSVSDIIKINDNKLQLQTASNVMIGRKAAQLEREAFQYLLNKDMTNAIKIFDECNTVFSQYHSVFEISNYLKKVKKTATDEDWKEIYATVLSKYSWKLPEDIREKLK